jgi:hypothetical protein
MFDLPAKIILLDKNIFSHYVAYIIQQDLSFVKSEKETLTHFSQRKTASI